MDTFQVEDDEIPSATDIPVSTVTKVPSVTVSATTCFEPTALPTPPQPHNSPVFWEHKYEKLIHGIPLFLLIYKKWDNRYGSNKMGSKAALLENPY